jgi:hypothetical protein
MRFHAFVASFLAAASAQTPAITAAGWTQGTCPGSAAPCSLPPPVPPPPTLSSPPPLPSPLLPPPGIFFTVAGDNFGTTQGQLQKGDFLAPAPPPPAMPWDTPEDLFPSNLATRTGGNGVCVARSLYTGDGFAYRFCPFQRMEHFEGSFSIGSLGTYAGVLRDTNNVNCPGSNAIVGMKFLDGSLCNGVPSTSTINFVCLDVLGPGLATWGTNTPMINAAIRSADGCSVNTTLPLPGACDGARFSLCGSPLASPNPVPTPSPTFSFTQATVTSWADGAISAYAPGTMPPPAVRVQRGDNSAVSTGYEPEAGPLPPSASPIPTPFPSNLEVIGIVPNQGVRGQCTPVTIMLAGLTQQDIVGTGFSHSIRMRLPTGPSTAMNYIFQGLPGPVNGAQPVAPPVSSSLPPTLSDPPIKSSPHPPPPSPSFPPLPLQNGLINVTLPNGVCAGGNFPNFPTTQAVTVGSFWSQASLGTHLIRAAVCQPSNPQCLQWTYCNAISPTGVCT